MSEPDAGKNVYASTHAELAKTTPWLPSPLPLEPITQALSHSAPELRNTGLDERRCDFWSASSDQRGIPSPAVQESERLPFDSVCEVNQAIAMFVQTPAGSKHEFGLLATPSTSASSSAEAPSIFSHDDARSDWPVDDRQSPSLKRTGDAPPRPIPCGTPSSRWLQREKRLQSESSAPASEGLLEVSSDSLALSGDSPQKHLADDSLPTEPSFSTIASDTMIWESGAKPQQRRWGRSKTPSPQRQVEQNQPFSNALPAPPQRHDSVRAGSSASATSSANLASERRVSESSGSGSGSGSCGPSARMPGHWTAWIDALDLPAAGTKRRAKN